MADSVQPSVLPPGPPFGSWDAMEVQAPYLLVSGWALDPTAPGVAIDVHVYLDGRGVAVAAFQSRPDVDQAIPGAGEGHGFGYMTDPGPGQHTVCIYALAIGGHTNTSLGCRSVITGSTSPVGSFDGGRAQHSSFQLSGWAFDPDRPDAIIQVHVYVAGQGRVLTANRMRQDVGFVFPAAGSQHGWETTVTPTGPGPVSVCAYAIDDTGQAPHTSLGCRTFAHGRTSPIGSLDEVDVDGPYVVADGWVLDPDQLANGTSVVFELDGVAMVVPYSTVQRTDVAAAFPGAHQWSGWHAKFAVHPGRHTLCVDGQDMETGRSSRIGCRSISTEAEIPRGSLDVVTASNSQIVVSGWAFDPDDPTGPFSVQVEHTDGAFSRTVSTGMPRPDVARAFPGVPENTGWSTTLWARPGSTYRVCVWTEETVHATFLGCRVVTA